MGTYCVCNSFWWKLTKYRNSNHDTTKRTFGKVYRDEGQTFSAIFLAKEWSGPSNIPIYKFCWLKNLLYFWPSLVLADLWWFAIYKRKKFSILVILETSVSKQFESYIDIVRTLDDTQFENYWNLLSYCFFHKNYVKSFIDLTLSYFHEIFSIESFIFP